MNRVEGDTEEALIDSLERSFTMIEKWRKDPLPTPVENDD